MKSSASVGVKAKYHKTWAMLTSSHCTKTNIKSDRRDCNNYRGISLLSIEVKQGCVLAPTLFGIFFAVMLKHAFGPAAEGIYLRTMTGGKLFNLSSLRAKNKVQLRCLCDFLSADDTAVTAHSAQHPQQLMTRFSDACQDFGFTISLKKTQVMGQDVDSPSHQHQWPWTGCHPWLRLSGFNYLRHPLTWRRAQQAHRKGSYHHDQTDKESMEQQQADWAHKDSDLQSLLREHSPVWQRVLHIVCATRAKAFHMRSLRRILNITWQDKVSNNTVLERAGCISMFTLLKYRHMRWLGHVVHMDDGRIPKDRLYGELVQGKRPTGRSQLRFKDVCKRDLKESLEHRPEQLPSSKRHSLSSTKRREWEERLQPMQTDQRQTSSVPFVTGTVIPASDWPATSDAVPEYTPRTQLHNLPRLKDAYKRVVLTCSESRTLQRWHSRGHCSDNRVTSEA